MFLYNNTRVIRMNILTDNNLISFALSTPFSLGRTPHGISDTALVRSISNLKSFHARIKFLYFNILCIFCHTKKENLSNIKVSLLVLFDILIIKQLSIYILIIILLFLFFTFSFYISIFIATFLLSIVNFLTN